jgi:hypothetical protein
MTVLGGKVVRAEALVPESVLDCFLARLALVVVAVAAAVAVKVALVALVVKEEVLLFLFTSLIMVLGR